MYKLTEREILIQIQNDNLENYNFIYKKYYRKIFFLTLKMTSNEKIAEDLTQEVFIDIIHCLKKLKNIDLFEAWLSKIAMNKVNTHRKKILAQKEKIFTYDSEILNNIPNTNFSLETEILKKDFNKEFLKLIKELPEKKQRIVILYYYENFSINEISTIENIPVGTVKSRLHTSKKILKNSLKLKKLINNSLTTVLIFLIFSFNHINLSILKNIDIKSYQNKFNTIHT